MKVGPPFRHSWAGLMESHEGMGLTAELADPAVPADDGDLALARRCRSGDRSAWRQLYDSHHAFVYRVARRLGTPTEEAEDVVHEVFLVVMRKLDRFTGGRLTTWLYRITANVVSHRHRKRRVRRNLVELAARIGWSSPADPESLAAAQSDARAVERILEQMKPKKREVFALFELEGLTGEEISERVGCPVNTVWTRLHHARAEFLQIGHRLKLIEASP